MEKGERKTKIVTVGGLRCFIKNYKTIPQTSRGMFTAFRISITFLVQKNEHLWDTISQEYAQDRQLNLVALVASLVWRIRNAPSTNDDTHICCYHQNHELMNMNQAQVLDYLRGTAVSIGEATLGFAPHEIGNESIRSGGCMASFLVNHPVEHIKMMGRWDSES